MPADAFELNDDRNAQRLVKKYGNDLRFCHPWSSWLIWDGKRWRRDDRGEATLVMKLVMRDLEHEAVSIADDDERRRALRTVGRYQQAPRIRGALELAESEEG